MDAYKTVLTGTRMINIFPLGEELHQSESSLIAKVTGMHLGLPWSHIGWDVLSFDVLSFNVNSLVDCSSSRNPPSTFTLTYVNQAIPPPFYARIHHNQYVHLMLFLTPHHFVEQGNLAGRELKMDEYHQMIIMAQLVLTFKGFSTYLCDLRDWEEELSLVNEDEGNIHAMECFANSNHPSDVHCKDAFV
jgi:hypothetical protein